MFCELPPYFYNLRIFDVGKMKTKERNYTIIVVSPATLTNKEFVISSKLIRNSIIGFFVLVCLFGFLTFDYLTTAFDKEKMKRLHTDNIEKEETIAKLSDAIKGVEERLQKMEDYKHRISVAMGLTSPDALKEVGIGGPVVNMPDGIESPGNQLNQDLKGQTKRDILKRAELLSKNSKKIEDTLKFVESIMEKQKVRLACTPSIWPTKGYLTSPLGMRIHPLTGKRSFHNGQDIATQYGNKVIAPADGHVLVVEARYYYGRFIIIDHGFGFTTRYGHLASYNVKEGDRVKRGQVIGYVGNTGRSSAPHLHYEVRYFGKAQNPMNFIID